MVGDGSRYDDEYFAPAGVRGVAGLEAGPYDALMANDSRVLFEPIKANDPAQGAAQEFVRMLAEQGIAVGGRRYGRRRRPTPSSSRRSSPRPLADVVAEMLANSDNNTAELLVKEIGFRRQPAPARREAGLAVIERTLAGWAVDTAADGVRRRIGLSPDNRVTCTALLAVLQRSDPTARSVPACRSPGRPARCPTSSSTIRSPAACSARRAR